MFCTNNVFKGGIESPVTPRICPFRKKVSAFNRKLLLDAEVVLSKEVSDYALSRLLLKVVLNHREDIQERYVPFEKVISLKICVSGCRSLFCTKVMYYGNYY